MVRTELVQDLRVFLEGRPQVPLLASEVIGISGHDLLGSIVLNSASLLLSLLHRIRQLKYVPLHVQYDFAKFAQKAACITAAMEVFPSTVAAWPVFWTGLGE